MKHVFFALIFAAFCATAVAQTLKSVMVNSNNQVVAATNITFTNALGFTTNAAATTRSNLFTPNTPLMFATNGQVIASTGTNVLTFTPELVTFNGLAVQYVRDFSSALSIDFANGEISGNWGFYEGIGFFENAAATTRANLGFSTNLNTLWAATNAAAARSAVGLPLAALTNTSNESAMRALAGSTNSAEPYSGTITLVDSGSIEWAIVVSNGIITSVYNP